MSTQFCEVCKFEFLRNDEIGIEFQNEISVASSASTLVDKSLLGNGSCFRVKIFSKGDSIS